MQTAECDCFCKKMGRSHETELFSNLKGTYYENYTFVVLQHVNLGIWHVYRPKNSGKKKPPAICCGSSMSETIH